MKILVTGGLGVIGSCFAENMLKEGHEVSIIDSGTAPRNHWLHKKLIRSCKEIEPRSLQSIASTSWFVEELEKFDLVLHAAASTGIPHSAKDPNFDWENNVDASKALCDALRKCSKPPKTVVLSSVKPYDLRGMPTIEKETCYETANPYHGGVDESYPLDPDEPYAASKAAQSALCIAYARTYNLPLTVFRCSNLYGPAPCHGPRHGWLTWFAISAALGRPLIVQGTGKQTRDMLHADDVTSAVLAAAEHIGDCSGQLFNLGGGQINTVSVMEAAEWIKDYVDDDGDSPVQIQWDRQGGRRFEDKLFVTNHSKFTDLTGWTPQRVLLDQDGDPALVDIVDWAFQNAEELRPLYEGL
jgi:CDP-paratose 2-epimerase